MGEKKFKTGDFVILVDQMDSEERKKQLGIWKKPKRDSRKLKLSFLDTIDKIQANKAYTKKHKFKTDKLQTHEEDQDDRDQRFGRGEPERLIYFANPSWFPLPSGLQCTIDSVELDDEFVKNVVLPYQEE